MAIKIEPWDVAQYLKSEADMVGYLDACLELEDPALVADALGLIARARSMSQFPRDTSLG